MDVCPAFVDETGLLSGPIENQPIYGIGLLVIPNPHQLTDALYKVHFNLNARKSALRASIRRGIHEEGRRPSVQELDALMWGSRHHEYKFSAVSPYNVQEYIDLLSVFFAHPGPEFHSLVVDRTAPGFGLQTWGGDAWTAYCSLSSELLAQSLDRDVFAIVDLQAKPDRSGHYLEETLCAVPHVTGCLRASSETSVFLQLVDVLVGCVQFDIRDQRRSYSAESKRGSAKRDLVRFLKGRLGLALNEAFLPDSAAYMRGEDGCPFSIWRWNHGRVES